MPFAVQFGYICCLPFAWLSFLVKNTQLLDERNPKLLASCPSTGIIHRCDSVWSKFPKMLWNFLKNMLSYSFVQGRISKISWNQKFAEKITSLIISSAWRTMHNVGVTAAFKPWVYNFLRIRWTELNKNGEFCFADKNEFIQLLYKTNNEWFPIRAIEQIFLFCER